MVYILSSLSQYQGDKDSGYHGEQDSPNRYSRDLPTSLMNGETYTSSQPETREERIARHKAKAATFPAKPQGRGRHRRSLPDTSYYNNTKLYGGKRQRWVDCIARGKGV